MGKFWKYSDCGSVSGLVIADTEGQALKKLVEKYGMEKAIKFILWEWVKDDSYDMDNPDVFETYRS